jgi:predicted HicB family RNase H-like nuclease
MVTYSETIKARVDPRDAKALERIARRKRVKLAQVVREALAAYIEQSKGGGK